ncbi:MAG: hypothetical protein V7L25_32285 [Nostoc sp.]
MTVFKRSPRQKKDVFHLKSGWQNSLVALQSRENLPSPIKGDPKNKIPNRFF